jgi:hypothetical protein
MKRTAPEETGLFDSSALQAARLLSQLRPAHVAHGAVATVARVADGVVMGHFNWNDMLPEMQASVLDIMRRCALSNVEWDTALRMLRQTNKANSLVSLDQSNNNTDKFQALRLAPERQYLLAALRPPPSDKLAAALAAAQRNGSSALVDYLLDMIAANSTARERLAARDPSPYDAFWYAIGATFPPGVVDKVSRVQRVLSSLGPIPMKNIIYGVMSSGNAALFAEFMSEWSVLNETAKIRKSDLLAPCAYHGQVDMLNVLYPAQLSKQVISENIRTYKMILACVSRGHTEVLEWMLAKMLLTSKDIATTSVASEAIRCHSLTSLQFLTSRLDWCPGAWDMQHLCDKAVKAGNIPILEYLLSLVRADANAARYPNVTLAVEEVGKMADASLFDWFLDRGLIELKAETMVSAFIRSSFNMVEWLITHGCPFDHGVLLSALEAERLNIASDHRHSLESAAAVMQSICHRAVAYGSVRILAYLDSLLHSPDERAGRYSSVTFWPHKARASADAGLFDWFFAKGLLPLTADTMAKALVRRSFSMILWLMEHGCPFDHTVLLQTLEVELDNLEDEEEGWERHVYSRRTMTDLVISVANDLFEPRAVIQ